MSFDFASAREKMVEQQVRPWDVLDVRVLDALARTPRETFVAPALRGLAYADMALPIGHDQTMMPPVLEGRALQAIAPGAEDCVLEIGTGSGYLSACLAQLAREVVSVERVPELAQAARARLAAAGHANVRVVEADALGWAPGRSFDAICVTAAVDAMPATFTDWLAPGGRLFIVRGRSPAMEAVIVRRDGDGTLRTESLFETVLPYLVGAEPRPAFNL